MRMEFTAEAERERLCVGDRYRSKANHRAVVVISHIERKVTLTVHTEDRSHYPSLDTLDAIAFDLLYEPVPAEESDAG